MKSTGIVRPVDQLGRVVIPKELRRTMNITNDTPMEVYTDGDTIILKKYAPGCSICGRSDKYMREFGGLQFCENHWELLKMAASETIKKDR